MAREEARRRRSKKAYGVSRRKQAAKWRIPGRHGVAVAMKLINQRRGWRWAWRRKISRRLARGAAAAKSKQRGCAAKLAARKLAAAKQRQLAWRKLAKWRQRNRRRSISGKWQRHVMCGIGGVSAGVR